MDPRDLFRGIFGFDKHRFDGSDRNRTDIDRILDEDDDEEYEDGSDIDNMFRHFHDEMQNQMEHLGQQMEEMFRMFGATEFPPITPNQPALPAPPVNPRDKMLKEPDDTTPPDSRPRSPPSKPAPRGREDFSLFGKLYPVPEFKTVQPFEKEDKVLDGEVDEKNLAKILVKPDAEERRVPSPFQPGGFSSHSSVSITTIRGADGKLEKRRTVRDSDGSEETTVTRQLGDKSHTVRTKKDEQGVVEETETFQNMEKDDLSIFAGDWRSKGRQSRDARDLMIKPPGATTDGQDSIFKKLFGLDFSGKK